MSIQLAQYRDLYFSESHEQLAGIAASLKKLEETPGDKSAFEAAFRGAHTLKGMSATMGYDEITIFAHTFEDLLQSNRDKPAGESGADIYTLFRSLDHLNRLLSSLEFGESSEGAPEGMESISIQTAAGREKGEVSSLVRVRFAQLDQLMARTLDLLASANHLAHALPGAQVERRGEKWREHLILVRDLQAAAWSVQMASVGEVFDRFPQMLHDLARAQGKEIRVEVQGREIEVGRSILDEVSEPLLHLLRNAVSHGIETLSERLDAGKEPRGTVSLRACQHGDTVIIEVGDDGRGLDAKRILQAAYEQSLISDSALRTLGEAEAYELIMRPGFSLAPVVTNASGRGVGLDIVRNQVQSLRGRMHIRSQPGHGTIFTLDLPRTFGGVQVELVRAGDQTLAIPATQIDSRVVLARQDLDGMRPGEFVTSDRIFNLVDLRSLVHLPSRPDADSYGLIVLNNGANLALRVDEFLGKALWSAPPDARLPAVPLLDLNHLPPA